ncbi:MAG: hypothetical protein BAJALOKI3v1_330017 [Promethearchaeota archaeon]|jgi:hypothetical protein|nr:MAG: hypothetical protein BAJALOKI3v1_330017 [Candidatus Lokiarchaeota archaeon]
MVKSRNLSKKITARLTISLSPYLKDLVKRYVKEKRQEYPDEEMYSSISRFISNIIEIGLEISDHYDSLEKLKKIPGKQILDFYDDISFRAVIDTYEENVEKSKYDLHDSDQIIALFLKFKDYLLKDADKLSDELMEKRAGEFNKYFVDNKVAKDFDIIIKGNRYLLDFSGTYPNIHFLYTKGIIGIFSVLGLKLIDAIIGRDYSKMEFEKTWLFRSSELQKKERKRLYQENMAKVINYNSIVNDKAHHLWIRLSDYENTVITFRNKSEGIKTVEEISQEIIRFSKYGYKRDILRLFEKLNWIKVTESLTKEIPFQFSISEQYHQMEREITLEILNSHGKIYQEDNTFYFK